MTAYTLSDVDAAVAKIRKACPDAHISRGDYDWSLGVARPDKTCAYWVFVPERPDIGQNGFVGDVDLIIAALLATPSPPTMETTS